MQLEILFLQKKYGEFVYQLKLHQFVGIYIEYCFEHIQSIVK